MKISKGFGKSSIGKYASPKNIEQLMYARGIKLILKNKKVQAAPIRLIKTRDDNNVRRLAHIHKTFIYQKRRE